MSEYAIIKFRAKRIDDATRWTTNPDGGSSFSEGHTAYNVPKITSSHVATPRTDQGTRHVLMFGGRTDEAILKSRTESLLKANGLDAYRIYAEDVDTMPGVVSIEPRGNGFMADITLRLELKK